MKHTVNYEDTDRGNDIQLQQIEIVVDPHDGRYVWIYMLDEKGTRVEGAGFNANDFMSMILKYYNDNY
jgi:hypothetical protein